MLKILILTGGKSTRMGRDKYLMKQNGKPQFEYLYDMFQQAGIPAFLSCSKEQDKTILDAYPKLIDLYDGIGPIGGIQTAIAHDAKSSWLVIACDLTNITIGDITQLSDANDEKHDVITYKKKDTDYYETTISIYNPSSFGLIKKQVEHQQYSLQKILKGSKVKVISPLGDENLKNVNRPEDV